VSEDNYTSVLIEKLNKTGSKIAELTSKVSTATKSAVTKTNQAVKTAVSNKKEKIESKREEKVAKTQAELSSKGIIDDVPPMVVLPEFETERMSIVNEQNENQMLVVEHMQRISERLDVLERSHQARLEELYEIKMSTEKKNSMEKESQTEIIRTSAAVVEALHVLGISIVWIAILIAVDKYSESNDIYVANIYSLKIFTWAIGAFTWTFYLMKRLLKSGIKIPLLIRVQTSLAVALITLMGILLNDDSMVTVSNVWTWGTLVTVGILMGSSMIATAWRATKRIVLLGSN